MNASAMPMPQAGNRHGGALKLHRRAIFGEVSNARLQPVLHEKQPLAGDGMVFAVNNLKLGVPSELPIKRIKGGARNRADRESHGLTPAQIANLSAAAGHAAAIGVPLNRMLTIHWGAAGVPLDGMAAATGRFTDLLAKAIARHGSRTAWAWVHENGPKKGWHLHLLAHVPAALVSRMTGLQRGWLRRITGKPYRARVIHSKPIGGRLGLEGGNPELQAVNLAIARDYILKGASPLAAAQFGLERLEPGGRIIGKRCGTSQNIGAKARKAKG